MNGPIYRFLAADHVRLADLLQRAVANPASIDWAAYGEFRGGLLKHIGMEEKILLPAARRIHGGEPLPVAAKLRLDHGAIAALLVPTPTTAIVAALRKILADHNKIEEGPGGLYETCDELLATQADKIVDRMRAAPDVPMNQHVDGKLVLDAARRALARAGYDLELPL